MSIRAKSIGLLLTVTISFQSRLSACGLGARGASADKPGALIVDGSSRSNTIHIPPNVRRRPPVVFMLHGRGGTKEQAAAEFGWRELADRENFIAVFPQALPIIPDLALDSSTPETVPSWLGSTNFTIWWSSGFTPKLARPTSPGRWGFLDTLDCEDSRRRTC
jgi:poly(3-hydroxybutyrate) depolymerase